MTSYTSNLGLLKKDPVADANDTFNIKAMLNDNWDKIDDAIGDIPNQVSELAEVSLTYKELPPGMASLHDLVEKGVYFVPNLGSYSGKPTHPTDSSVTWSGNSAIINVYDVRPPSTSSTVLRIKEAYIQRGPEQHFYKQNTVITGTGASTSITNYAWERVFTGAGGTITGAVALGSTLSVASDLTVNGRNVLTEIDAKQASIASVRVLELGANIDGSGAAIIDMHTNTTRNRTDFDARIAALPSNSTTSGSAVLELQAGDVRFITPTDSFTVTDLKQSGVNRKNELVSAINANGGSASASEDMSVLISKLATIARTRVKTYSPAVASAGVRTSAQSNEDLIILQSGFVSYMNVNSAKVGNNVAGLLELYLSTSSGTTNNNNATIYALDADGRRVNLAPLNGVSTAGSTRYWGINDIVFTTSNVTTLTYQNSGGPQFDLSPQTVSLPAGFDISRGIRIRCEILTTAQFYVTPRSCRLIGG